MDERIRVRNRLVSAPILVIKHLKKPVRFWEKTIAVVEKEIDAFCQSQSRRWILSLVEPSLPICLR